MAEKKKGFVVRVRKEYYGITSKFSSELSLFFMARQKYYWIGYAIICKDCLLQNRVDAANILQSFKGGCSLGTLKVHSVEKSP